MTTSLEIVNDAITGATATLVWGSPGSGKLGALLEQVRLVAPSAPVIFCVNEVLAEQIRQRLGEGFPAVEIVQVETAKDILDCIARAPKGSWVFVESVTNLIAFPNALAMVTNLARAAQERGVILWMSAQQRREAIRQPFNAPISGTGSDLDT